jgi:uncharacterized membrane protein
VSKQNKGVSHTTTRVEWRGPLPPPQALSGYESIVPGAAERLLRMTEDEAAHRRSLEVAEMQTDNAAMESHLRWMARGQWFGFAVSLCAIICGSITAIQGGDMTGLAAVLAGAGVMALGAIFARRRS